MFCEPPPRSPTPHLAHTSHFTMAPHAHSPQPPFPSSGHYSQSHFPALSRPTFSPAFSSSTSPSSSPISSHPTLIPTLHHAHSSHTVPASTSAFADPSRPGPLSHSQSQRLIRPKPLKKSSSTSGKHRNVQASLEVKVEKAKGFHAFFVPLCRGGLPPAPPCSPVLGHDTSRGVSEQAEREFEGSVQHQQSKTPDYFGTWSLNGQKGSEEWVENVQDGMEVDVQME